MCEECECLQESVIVLFVSYFGLWAVHVLVVGLRGASNLVYLCQFDCDFEKSC